MLEYFIKDLQVIKKSGKPFKSKSKIEKVVGLITNPFTKRLAVLFEDESFCDIRSLELYHN
jgi:hypothetical protein